MNDIGQMCADLRAAARYLLEDGHSIDEKEAVRIGMFLCELAGSMRAGTKPAPDALSA